MRQTIQDYNKMFWEKIHSYDISNTNIIRKVIHSFAVADNCFAIACREGLDEEKRNFAYLIGLFHDLGRFEQWKIYQTFEDKISVDHGDLSAQIINKLSAEKLYLTEQQKNMMSIIIKYHTKPYKGLNKEIIYFNNILKNADAYANVVTTANGAQQMAVEKTGYREQLLDDFINMRTLNVYCCQTKLERCLMLTACCYYTKLNFLRKEIVNNKYIDAIYNTSSKYLNEDEKALYYNAIQQLKKNYLQKNNYNLFTKLG